MERWFMKMCKTEKSNDENITLTPRPHVKLTQSKSN